MSAATFRLVVRPDGRAILTTTRQLSPSQVAAVGEVVRDWSSVTPPFVAILPDCDVVQVVDVELELPEAVPA